MKTVKTLLQEQEKKFLLTIKEGSKVISQKVMTYNEALNLVRRAMLAIESMEETSADFKAMAFLDSIKPGKARGIENRKNKRKLVVQIDR